jgi:hypothetical protein
MLKPGDLVIELLEPVMCDVSMVETILKYLYPFVRVSSEARLRAYCIIFSDLEYPFPLKFTMKESGLVLTSENPFPQKFCP